jgi:hypothetical protein
MQAAVYSSRWQKVAARTDEAAPLAISAAQHDLLREPYSHAPVRPEAMLRQGRRALSLMRDKKTFLFLKKRNKKLLPTSRRTSGSIA